MAGKQSEDGRLSTDTRYPDTGGEIPALSQLEVPALTILAHPDPRRIGELVTLPELSAGESVQLSRRVPLFAPPGKDGARSLGDPQVSRTPLRLVSGSERSVALERAGSPTPVLLDGEPLDERRSIDAAQLARGAVLALGRNVAVLLHLQPPVALQVPRFGLVGDSGAMMRLRREIEIAARLDTSLLLRGASGTGKELVARAVHDAGERCGEPWVTVNMAAIPSTLAAAELFGARKGAYTGADRSKPGFFSAASGGTLFLDEVGDTPFDVQPLLLRALENGEIQPVGSAETEQVDVRVIAATDADLEDAVAAGRFRSPLLHRLAVWEIHLPALTERRSDVGRLLVYYLEKELGPDMATSSCGPWASASMMTRLALYDWPGNVRQLSNVARRLAVSFRLDPDTPFEAVVEPLLLGAPPRPAIPTVTAEVAAEPPGSAETSPTGRWRPVYRKGTEIGEEELLAALRAHQWDLKPTAEALGISRSVLYQLIEACPRVRPAAQLDADEIDVAVTRYNGDLTAAAAALEVSAQGLKLRMKALGLR